MIIVQVGSQPGVTTHAQEVMLDRKLRLLDTPGIVFAGGVDAVLRNGIKVSMIQDCLPPVAAILARCRGQVEAVYNVVAGRNVNDFLVELAKKLGRIQKVCWTLKVLTHYFSLPGRCVELGECSKNSVERLEQRKDPLL